MNTSPASNIADQMMKEYCNKCYENQKMTPKSSREEELNNMAFVITNIDEEFRFFQLLVFTAVIHQDRDNVEKLMNLSPKEMYIRAKEIEIVDN